MVECHSSLFYLKCSFYSNIQYCRGILKIKKEHWYIMLNISMNSLQIFWKFQLQYNLGTGVLQQYQGPIILLRGKNDRFFIRLSSRTIKIEVYFSVRYFSRVRFSPSLVISVVFCKPLFLLFPLVIVLSVLLRFAASDIQTILDYTKRINRSRIKKKVRQ